MDNEVPATQGDGVKSEASNLEISGDNYDSPDISLEFGDGLESYESPTEIHERVRERRRLNRAAKLKRDLEVDSDDQNSMEPPAKFKIDRPDVSSEDEAPPLTPSSNVDNEEPSTSHHNPSTEKPFRIGFRGSFIIDLPTAAPNELTLDIFRVLEKTLEKNPSLTVNSEYNSQNSETEAESDRESYGYPPYNIDLTCSTNMIEKDYPKEKIVTERNESIERKRELHMYKGDKVKTYDQIFDLGDEIHVMITLENKKKRLVLKNDIRVIDQLDDDKASISGFSDATTTCDGADCYENVKFVKLHHSEMYIPERKPHEDNIYISQQTESLVTKIENLVEQATAFDPCNKQLCRMPVVLLYPKECHYRRCTLRRASQKKDKSTVNLYNPVLADGSLGDLQITNNFLCL